MGDWGSWQKKAEATHVRVFDTSIEEVLSMASIQTRLGSERSGNTDWGGESTSIDRIGVAALITPVVIRNERRGKTPGGLVKGETITTTANLSGIT
jgi:hypothetical protein